MIELLAGTPLPNETRRSMQACNDYLRMGAGRSLQKLLNRYQNDTESPPTKRLKTLKDWSVSFNWQIRAATHDAEVERQKNDAAEQHRREALETGLALDHERVLALKKLALLLETEIAYTDQNGDMVKVWLPDVKQIGSGEFASRVDLVRFNAPIFEQLRGIYDDLAKEVGGRKQKLEHSGPGGGPIETKDVGLSDEERLARITLLFNKAGEGRT